VRFRERRSLDAVARPPTRWLAVAAGLAVAALAGGLLLSVLQLRGTLREASAEKEALRRTAAEQERQLRGQESRIATLATELERLRAATADLGTLLSVTDLKRVATVVLRAGLQREGGDVPRVVLEPGTELVRVTVPLKMDRYPSYAVSIQDVDGRELWSRDGLHSLPRVRVPVGTLSVYGPGLVLFVPASVLVPEHYVVAVRGQGQPASQLHAEFVLQVVRR
jgi:hypothetical protein